MSDNFDSKSYDDGYIAGETRGYRKAEKYYAEILRKTEEYYKFELFKISDSLQSLTSSLIDDIREIDPQDNIELPID